MKPQPTPNVGFELPPVTPEVSQCIKLFNEVMDKIHRERIFDLHSQIQPLLDQGYTVEQLTVVQYPDGTRAIRPRWEVESHLVLSLEPNQSHIQEMCQ